MLEVFKIVVLCLICTIFTALFSTVLLTTVLFIVLTVLFYDFDFETPFERHAINKIKHAYLKVRNIHQIIHPNLNYSNQYICTPNMSNINKPAMDFDLSRFNRSGSVFSPISRIGGSASSRRLPTQTSTPLTRNSPWQKNSSSPVKAMTFQSSTIIRSPRYSLSSSDVKNTSQSPTVQTVAGPLLASSRFNINLGTYTDTKSPGLVSRVVQYHNESQSKEAQTHQSKYKSPGQFPIVQLYKKKLPLLTRAPKRCTVRVAPPDCITYNSPEGNQILRETFVQHNAENNTQSETEINTKSVLDALKEISRKRIHANDDLDDISKRQRKSSVINTDNTNKDGKRLREDTPPKPKGTAISPSSNKPKKICVTDEIECSLSSSILMRQQGQKRKAGISGENTIKIVKQRKISSDGNHISRETQTSTQTNNSKSVTHSTQTNFNEAQQTEKQPSFQKKTADEKQPEEKEYTGLQQILQNAKRKKKQYFEKSIEEIDEERSSVQFNESQPFKPLFSHEPMEIIMKNRLEVAMAALNGDKPEIIPLPKLTLTQMLEKNKELAQKDSSHALKESRALTSILSPKKKTKHDKHVSFDIPTVSSTDVDPKSTEKSTINQDITSTPSILPVTTISEVTTPEKSQFSAQISFGAITNTTVSNNTTPTPLVKDTPQPSPQMKFGENKINFGGDTTPKTPPFGGLTPSIAPNSIVNTPSGISFGAPNNSCNANLSFGVSSSNNAIPTFGNNPPISAICSVPNTQTGTSFGAALNVPKSVVPFGALSSVSNTSTIVSPISSSQNTKLSISFGTPQAIPYPSSTPNTSAPTFGAPTQTAQSLVTFGQTTQNSTNFGTPTQTTKSLVNFGATPQTTQSPISFGTPIQTTQSLVSFSTPNQTTPSSVPFGAPVSSTNSGFSFGAKSETNVAPPSFNFGGTKSPPKTGGFKFDLGKPATEAPKTNFGDNSANKTPAFAFGATNNNASSLTAFGANTTNSAPVFGGTLATTSAPAFGSSSDTKPISAFGAPALHSTTPAAGFGLPSTTNTTTSSVFGATTNPPTFGAPKTTENKPGFAFGTATTQSSTFGGFNAPTTTQNSGFAFGGSQPKSTTNAVSTTSNTFSFGGAPQNNKPFSFNAPTTTASNVFGGANPPPAFGATNPPPAFGAQAPSSGVFGAPTTTSGGVFGPPNTTNQASNVFGAPTTTSAVFGANTTTTTANAFGQPSSGSFGSNPPGFGATPANGSVFGAQNNINNNNNSFGGTTTPTASFGAPNQAPFASGAQSNVFGGNSGAQSNVFGSPSSTPNKPTFGGSNTPNFAGSFGNTNAPTPAFGGNPTPATSNVFGANTNQPTTFGASNNNNNNNPASAGAFGSFGAANQTQQQGVFSFGGNAPNAGATNAFQFAGSSTPTKPAGFNFSTSTTTPNLNFSSGNPTPSFGGNPPPAFGAPNTGMFSIGSGSTAPKQRPMIKARRRNN